ncbi:MAG: hemerythrin domain-containing protein [bacterium]|nr:hemerythrin domain-containing protein [bacterium]
MYATDELRHEHEIILHLIAALSSATEQLVAGKLINTADLADMVEAIRTFADNCHHGKEEDCLFPAMEAMGMSREMGPIGVMLHEHEMGRKFVRGMMNGLEDMKAGQSHQSFAENASGYVSLLASHIFKENNILFTMAEQSMSPAMHADLKEKFDSIERERIGEGVHEKIHADVHRWFDLYAEK